jgi:hypothetical protein
MNSDLVFYGGLLTEAKGFSAPNIKQMSTFFREYPALAIGQQPVAQLGSMDNLMEKVPQAAAQLLETKDFPFVQEPIAQIPWDHNILGEYGLRDIHKPIGISDYELTRALPENLKSSLPTVEEIEAEL